MGKLRNWLETGDTQGARPGNVNAVRRALREEREAFRDLDAKGAEGDAAAGRASATLTRAVQNATAAEYNAALKAEKDSR